MYHTYFVAVLGARHSGKSVLASACAHSHDSSELSEPCSELSKLSEPRPFAALRSERAECLSVLDPKRHSDDASLGRALARRAPFAVLLTLPRDIQSASLAQREALRWANLARAHTDRARLALVVTKCDAARPPLDEVPFERAAYDVMRVAGVEQIFYTEALRRGPEGVHAWLMDVLAERRLKRSADRRSRYTVCFDPVDWGVADAADAAGAPKPNGLEIAHADPHQRTCDQCAVS